VFSPEQTLRYADAFLKYNDNPVEFDPWQEIFLKDQSTFIILLKGRQEGFSFAVAAKKFIELQNLDVVNMTVQFVSYNLMDAVDKIRYISMMAHSMPEKHRKKIKYETKTSIEFWDKNGKTTSRLVSIACRPPRGKPGDVVLDECAIYGTSKAKMIYTAALPSITRGGNIIIGSTPLGKIGIFYDIYTDKKEYSNYARYTIPWWQSTALCKSIVDARATGVKDMDTEDRVRIFGNDILKNELAALDLQSFQQEYECTFIDSAESYISLEDRKSVV
jgi:phage FluMu gp28-like protein